MTERLIAEFARQRRTITPTTVLAELTDREAEVLRLIDRGLSNADTAEHLTRTGNTVRSHINRLFRKLDVHDRAQAVILAYENSLVGPRSFPAT